MVLDDKVALITVKLGHLAVERDRDTFLRGLVELCSQAADAERAIVYLVDEEHHEIYSKVAQPPAFEIRLPVGVDLVGHSAATGETINVPDADADPRFDRSTDLRSGFRTLNVLVVPVWSIDGRRVIAVIQVLNKENGTFERRDQMLLERVSEAVAPALEQILSRGT